MLSYIVNRRNYCIHTQIITIELSIVSLLTKIRKKRREVILACCVHVIARKQNGRPKVDASFVVFFNHNIWYIMGSFSVDQDANELESSAGQSECGCRFSHIFSLHSMWR